MTKLVVIVTLAAFIAGTSMGCATAASFDCAKATVPSDIAVCSNPELSTKDDELGQLYQQRKADLQSRGGDVQGLILESRRLLTMRMACKADLLCLNAWYNRRISGLKIAGPTAGAPSTAPSDPAFLQGQTDRAKWESWFSGLTGDYRAGAEYWAAHRSDRPPASCNASTLSISNAWSTGCLAAKARLTPIDQRRRREPTYRLGWNSVEQPTTSGAPSDMHTKQTAPPIRATDLGSLTLAVPSWARALLTLFEAGWFYSGQSKNAPIAAFHNYRVVPQGQGIWIARRRYEFAEPREHNDLSLIGTFAVDCRGQRLRLISETDFQGRNLTGNITYYQNYPDANWYYPDPGSGDDSLIKYTCDGELMESNIELANLAGTRFSEILDTNGISGVESEIANCYQKAGYGHDRSDLFYCVALDEAAGLVERSVERTQHFPVIDFFGERETTDRVRHNFGISGITNSSDQDTNGKLLGNQAMAVINEHYLRKESTTTKSSVAGPTNVPAPANSSSIHRVQMGQGGGTYFVPVQINNALTLKFVVDSGAADVSIPADVVMTLFRTGTLQASDFLGTQTFVLADGSQIPSQEFRIRSLRIGNTVLENVIGSVADVKGQLLLGQSFLSRFKSWAIDNQQKVLVLEDMQP